MEARSTRKRGCVIDHSDPQISECKPLASRAFVRARLQQWDAALADAEMVLVALLSIC